MKKKEVNISVIIPTYKSWDLLEKCLYALSQQTLEEAFEVLVVNNDTDSSIPKTIQRFEFVQFFQELHPGSYAARNKGIREAKGDVLVFTDADCIPKEDWLEQGIKILRESDTGLVGGPVKLFYKNPEKLNAAEIYDKYTGFDVEGYIKQGCCTTANWFSYKKTMEDAGLFNANLKSNGDTELSQKISSKHGITYAKQALVFHPARYTVEEIITKHKRLIGGAFDWFYREEEKHKNFRYHVLKFIYRRMRFNLKLLLIGRFRDSYFVFIVHMRMFPKLIREYSRIIKMKETERR